MNGRPAFFISLPGKPVVVLKGYAEACFALMSWAWALPCKLIRAKHGEHGWNRTNDHLIKSQVLYRLSYVLSKNLREEFGLKKVVAVKRAAH